MSLGRPSPLEYNLAMQRVLEALGPDVGSIAFDYTAPSRDQTRSAFADALSRIGTRETTDVASRQWSGDSWFIRTTTRGMPERMKRLLDIPPSATNKLVWLGPLDWDGRNCILRRRERGKDVIGITIAEEGPARIIEYVDIDRIMEGLSYPVRRTVQVDAPIFSYIILPGMHARTEF